MPVWLLTVYVLMWPVVVAGIIVVISRAFIGEWMTARKEGRDII